MRKKGSGRLLGLILAMALLALSMSPPLRALAELPGRLYLSAGEALDLRVVPPVDVEIDSGRTLEALSSADERLSEHGRYLQFSAGEGPGEARLIFHLLGLLPLKTVSVTVAENMPPRLVPGGHSLGVALLTEGVVVVGASDLGGVASPARVAGLKAGDRIVALNGASVESAAQLSSLIQEGRPCSLAVVRDDEQIDLEITPALDGRDGSYRLGMWVRDSTAGIGTLSFYDPQSRAFGALGHAVADVDTGVVLPVSEGGIYESSIVDVTPGRQGAPGELMGQFFGTGEQIGEITGNTDCGIFGKAQKPFINPLYPDGLPVASRAEVREGPARLLTTLTGGEITAYDCAIIRVNRDDPASPRSMLIEITDPELLRKTGGIVQGMSGSPIIQDDRIVGAVTHVLVNDPTRGYGIFIENMLEAAETS